MNFLTPLAAVTALLVTTTAPPTARVPYGPLERNDPKIWDVAFNVTIMPPDAKISTVRRKENKQGGVRIGRPADHEELYGKKFELKDAVLGLPLMVRSPYSAIDLSSIDGSLALDGRLIRNFAAVSRLDEGQPYGMQMAVTAIEEFSGREVRWRVSWKSQVWSSKIDDEAAARLPWPREWPADVLPALQPEFFIESDQVIFAETVERVAGGKSNVRLVAPYLAAKDLVRWCIANVGQNGSDSRLGSAGEYAGMNVKGAFAAARDGNGTSHDLVCTCVALLRAAGIPARPVIGIAEEESGKNRLRSWAEFYLEGAGWVPFDPAEMRGKGLETRGLKDAWTGFGTLKDLNELVPISHTFVPAANLQAPIAAALWGWDPRTDQIVEHQILPLETTGRGAGVPDER